MQFSSKDLWSLVFGAIVPQMEQGKNIGAFAPNQPGHPFIEWAYNTQVDTLVVLCFIDAPGPDSQPSQEYQMPQFGITCFKAMRACATLVQAGGGCGDPNCPDCGGGRERAPLDSGGGFMGFQRPDSEGDRIGFRPPGK